MQASYQELCASPMKRSLMKLKEGDVGTSSTKLLGTVSLLHQRLIQDEPWFDEAKIANLSNTL